jgi:hypothetical protein
MLSCDGDAGIPWCHYLSLEFPYLPMSLQQIIVVSLLEMGYTTSGRRGRHRFQRPAAHSSSGDRTA